MGKDILGVQKYIGTSGDDVRQNGKKPEGKSKLIAY